MLENSSHWVFIHMLPSVSTFIVRSKEHKNITSMMMLQTQYSDPAADITGDARHLLSSEKELGSQKDR